MAIAASRIVDILTDPLIGTMSDRWQTRWGRRKPWLVVGTPLLMLATWMVFVPGGQVSTAYLLAWTCLLYFSFTLIDLSTDYSERSRVTVWGKESGPVVFLTGLIVMGFYGCR